jgi:hypothetical protein
MTANPQGYPSRSQIEKASLVELVRWNRYLPTPSNDENRERIRLIIARINEAREQPGGREKFTAASKVVGWDG